MRSTDVLIEAFGRIQALAHEAVDGLTPDQLAFRIDSRANPIAWLVWHAARVQDDHVAGVAATEQVWTAGSWFEQFQLPFGPEATGFGQSTDDVAAVQVRSGELLTGYVDAVHDATLSFLGRVSDDDLDRIVDASWDPPVSLGARLVSVVSDDLQHVGQSGTHPGSNRSRLGANQTSDGMMICRAR